MIPDLKRSASYSFCNTTCWWPQMKDYFCLTVSGITGEGVGPEAPQFAQTSLKYLNLDHPLRRACIRSTFLFPSIT